MSHAIEYLSFPITESKSDIEAECDAWGDANRDHNEGGVDGLADYIDWRDDMVFDDYDSAYSYLSTHSAGNYGEMAVKYKKYPKIEPTKTMLNLERRINEYTERISVLDRPHYKNVQQATVKCKCCGSSLATEYCGKTYHNNCPVCNAELRPQSVLEKRDNYCRTLRELRDKLKEEQKKHEKKLESKAKIRWLVCCEVHC